MAENNKRNQTVETPIETCGVVMPISAIDGQSAEHWAEVFRIISKCISDAGLRPNLVSTTEVSGVIQGKIVQNLYSNPIVVCDVSGQNPNVMFELGLRLAFDKPTIVIIDDATKISFDVNPLHHLIYRRDLRFEAMQGFMVELTGHIIDAKKEVQNGNKHSFLKHFAPKIQVVDIETENVTKDQYILNILQELQSAVAGLGKAQPLHTNYKYVSIGFNFKTKFIVDAHRHEIESILLSYRGVNDVAYFANGNKGLPRFQVLFNVRHDPDKFLFNLAEAIRVTWGYEVETDMTYP